MLQRGLRIAQPSHVSGRMTLMSAAASWPPGSAPTLTTPSRRRVQRAAEASRSAVEALYRSARAHDRAAAVHRHSAALGIGDVDEHERAAREHNAAADAARDRADATPRNRPPLR